MTRKFTFLLMVLLALAGFKSWGQETLTVNSGTTQNANVPIYGWDSDSHVCSQFIIKSSDLTDMVNKSITKLTFYYKASMGSTAANTYKVFMKEIGEQESLSAFVSWSSMTEVYEGDIAISTTNSEKQLELSITSFNYSGGNLLIGFCETTTHGGYGMYNWMGVASYSGISAFGTGGSMGSEAFYSQDFSPKTTFTYEGASVSYDISYAQNLEHGSVDGPASALSGKPVNITATP